jgi:hypothetical protein
MEVKRRGRRLREVGLSDQKYYTLPIIAVTRILRTKHLKKAMIFVGSIPQPV